MLEEMKKEFEEHMLPFWKGMADKEYGGYYGFLDYDLKLDKKAVKGCILNSRIMWFFSNAYQVLGDKDSLRYAKHAYDFMKKYCVDSEYGGVFWSVEYDGEPSDTIKHTYNQAFAIYALSSYYEASGDEDALKTAWDLFNIIETKCRNEGGYLEAFTREFEIAGNDKLSENGVEASRTMNTLLHVLEAYTELCRVDRKEAVVDRLKEILGIFEDKIYNPSLGRMEVFFDSEYNTLIDLYSYGHDIETSWLIDRALEVLGDDEFKNRIAPITATLAAKVYEIAYTEQGMPAEAEKGVVLENRIWWVQAEAVVGFINAYQISGDEKYKQAAVSVWNFIKNNFVDIRPGSEWFWEVDKEGKPFSKKPIVEPWKCPYHTGRMYFEMVKRGISF